MFMYGPVLCVHESDPKTFGIPKRSMSSDTTERAKFRLTDTLNKHPPS